MVTEARKNTSTENFKIQLQPFAALDYSELLFEHKFLKVEEEISGERGKKKLHLFNL